MDQDYNESIPTQDEQEETINFRHYWHVILERRWLIITTFISVIALTLIYLFNATPIYQATVTLQIDKETKNVLNLQDAFAIDGGDQEYMVTQYKNLQSPALISQVVKRLKLDQNPRYAEARDVVKAVGGDFSISPVRLSRLVEVHAEHPDPMVATNMADTLVAIFIENDLNQKKQKVTKALQWLQEEADKLEVEVRKAEKDVQEYRRQWNMISLSDDENIVLQGLRQAQSDLNIAKAKATTAQKVAQSVKQMRESGMSLQTIPRIADDPEIRELNTKLSDAQGELAQLLKKFGPKWPDVIAAHEAIAEFKRQIEEKSEIVYEKMINAERIAMDEVKGYEEALKKQTEESLQLSQLRIEYDDLVRKAEKNQIMYNHVLQKIKETDITASDEKQNMFIRDHASLPYNPVKPRKLLTLFMGIVGGIGLALALAFFVNYLDDSIKSQDDIETYLKLNFMGYIPNIKSNSVVERDLQAHIAPQSTSSESFRTIRAAVSLLPNADSTRILAVTSTIPGEGKSLVCSNLAIVSAQTGNKTLLVDADLRRPSIHKAFQLQSPIGISAYLDGQTDDFNEITHPTEVPNLDAVCCGVVPKRPSELLGSKRMKAFFEEALKKYDKIFVDCPPVSAVSDPLVVASRTDGVVFVTKFNKIRREHARRSIQRLQDSGIHILGVVLNDIDFEGKDSHYYSYYYYQNRYYASHYKSQPEEKDTPKEKA